MVLNANLVHLCIIMYVCNIFMLPYSVHAYTCAAVLSLIDLYLFLNFHSLRVVHRKRADNPSRHSRLSPSEDHALIHPHRTPDHVLSDEEETHLLTKPISTSHDPASYTPPVHGGKPPVNMVKPQVHGKRPAIAIPTSASKTSPKFILVDG